MDIFLSSMEKSLKHLKVIDNAFSTENHALRGIYNEIKAELQTIDGVLPANKFSEELYVGGTKRNTSRNEGYRRQMILADVIEYIINGRGYFYAIRSKEAMSNYLRIIINIVNQLMILDSITVEIPLRKKILDELRHELGEDLFKDAERKKEHEALLLHEYPVGLPLKELQVSTEVLAKLELNDTQKEKAIKILGEYYDSLLPKTAGGLWGELIVYIYLLRKNIGFVFPLLLNQRLLTGDAKTFLKPPDLLLLPYGQQTFYGIEVGGGKEVQSGNFSIITGIPTATKANMDNPKRCCICGKWMLFCPQIVTDYCRTEAPVENIRKPVKCLTECRKYTREQILQGDCPYAMHKGGKPQDYIMEMKSDTYHFHLTCLKNDTGGRNDIREGNILAYYPYVGGLEAFEHMKINQEIVEEKLQQLKEYLAKINEKETNDQ